MESFYGGKPGAPFILKASFPDVASMRHAFMQGPEYKDVWYDEYCIISSPNSTNRDRGKIYRRTYNYESEEGCAEFVASIIGPDGAMPYVTMTSLGELNAFVESDLATPYVDDDNNHDARVYPYYDQSSESVLIYSDATNVGDDPDLHVFNLTTTGSDLGLVSGKDNHVIKYSWCNVKYANDDVACVKIGMQIPYPEFEFAAKSVSPYNVAKISKTSNSEATPFYHTFDLEVPKGVKGDSVEDFKLNANTGELTYAWRNYDKSAGGDILSTRGSAGIVPCVLETEIDDKYHLRIKYSSELDGMSYASIDNGHYWYDYGSVKDEDGIYIKTNVIGTETDPDQIVSKLNDEYPGGNGNRVITYGQEADIKQVFAYDYDAGTWYFLGMLGDKGSGIGVSTLSNTSDETITIQSSSDVPKGGYVFVSESVSLSDENTFKNSVISLWS